MQPGNSSYNISMEPGLPSDHVRKSSRLAHYDYSTAGAYFITVCCSDMRSIFGSVNGSEVELNAIGRLVSDELSLVHKHHKALTDTYIVMPNHWHAIIFIDPMMHVESLRDSELLLPAQEAHEQMLRPLPVLMNRLKRAMTLGIRQSLRNPQFEVFQRGYYEHIVRDDEDLATPELHTHQSGSLEPEATRLKCRAAYMRPLPGLLELRRADYMRPCQPPAMHRYQRSGLQ